MVVGCLVGLVGGDVGAATVGRLVVDGVAGDLGVSRVDGTTSDPTVGRCGRLVDVVLPGVVGFVVGWWGVWLGWWGEMLGRRP